MKKLKITMLLVSTLLLVSFSSENKYDKKLVGIWKGFEVDKQIEGVEKHWIVQRFSNGNYVIMFTTKQDCSIQTFTEKGKWWTKGNQFFEKQDESENTESYTYEVKDNLVVNFKSNGSEYEFDDFRID